MNTAGYKYLDLSKQFINNIVDQADQNDYETEMNIYKNKNIYPQFRYYKDDTNLNLTPKITPNLRYKNKSIFGIEKPIQTEQDEIGVSLNNLNRYYGYTNYGQYNYQNQNLPEYLKHKTTPKNYLFDLV